MNKALAKQTGFTIVELLIVIIVIGILAAVIIVAYNGIHRRAEATSLKSDLTQAAKLLAMDRETRSDNAYPPTEAEANGGKGLPKSSDTKYIYTVSGTGNDRVYYLTALSSREDGPAYYITATDQTIQDGVYADHVGVDPEEGWNDARTIWVDPSSGVRIASIYSGNQGFNFPGNLPYNDAGELSTKYIETSAYDCTATDGYTWGSWSYAGSGISHSIPTKTLAEQCPGGGKMIVGRQDTTTYEITEIIRYYTTPQI